MKIFVGVLHFTVYQKHLMQTEKWPAFFFLNTLTLYDVRFLTNLFYYSIASLCGFSEIFWTVYNSGSQSPVKSPTCPPNVIQLFHILITKYKLLKAFLLINGLIKTFNSKLIKNFACCVTYRSVT